MPLLYLFQRKKHIYNKQTYAWQKKSSFLSKNIFINLENTKNLIFVLEAVFTFVILLLGKFLTLKPNL